MEASADHTARTTPHLGDAGSARRRHPKVVQERLGHSTIGITLNTYSHVSVGMQREAAETVAALIFGA